MNKKFLSAILFGALMVTSTGTFVSCKDYDEDIENLQGQINNLATKSDVEAKLSQLQSAINTAKAEAVAEAKTAAAGEIAALEAEIAALEKCSCDVEAMLAKIKESVDADLANYKTELEELIAQAEGLVGQVADFVTSVELVYSNYTQTPMRYISVHTYKEVFENGNYESERLTNIRFDKVFETNEDGEEVLVGYTYYYNSVNNNNVNNAYDGEWLSTQTITELENSFGPSESSLIKFTKGEQHQRGDKFVVRVSPTNAVLTPEMITLVNSQGTALDIMEVKSVKPFTKLLGRSAANGLWEVEVALKEYDKETFDAAQWQKNVGYILYAVQVNNTLSTAATRNVTSTYDLSLDFHADFTGLGYLDFFVDQTHVSNINNRVYGRGSNSYADYSSSVTGNAYKEMEWGNIWEPAVAAITKGEKQNVWWTADNRGPQPVYPAVQGVPMTITLNDWRYGNDKVYDASSYIKALYVTLDKANAVESAPSELNAWNSYSYEGLDKVVEGTSTTITINAETAINDIIGFRVYAVNHDGTLVDPDGRAFYVRLGEQAAETQTIAATLTPKTTADNTVYVKLTDAQKAIIAAYYGVTPEVKADKDNKLITSGPHKQAASPVYDVTFVKNEKGDAAAKKEEMNYAKFTVANLADFIDGATYKQTLTFKNETNHVMGEIVCELVKTPWNEFPADFAFLPKQETEDGSGKFVAYMIPEFDYPVTTASANGYKELKNVFYGINDNNYEFVFTTSDVDADEDGVLDSKTVNADEAYKLTVATEFIDNESWHNVAVTYYYQDISTRWDAENEEWLVGDDWAVKYGKTLEVKYACWEHASAFVWGTYKSEDGKSVLSHKPALQWTAEGVGEKANLSDIESTNSYNNDYFGLDLETLVNTNKWLEIVHEKVKLTAGEQVNPYFKPEVKGSEIIFNQVSQQVDAAPTADHEETLTIVVKDAYGHESTITLTVTVKAPEKK